MNTRLAGERRRGQDLGAHAGRDRAPAYAFTAEAAHNGKRFRAEFHHAGGTSRTTPVTLTAVGWALVRRTRPRTTTA